MHRHVVVVSLALCACAARPVEEDGGTTTMVGSGSATTTQGESSEVGSITIGTSEAGDGDGDGDGDPETSGDGDGDDCLEPPKLDVPPDFQNTPIPMSCTVEPIEWGTLDQYPGCELCFENCYSLYVGCATPAPGQTCADICPSGDCLSAHPEICDQGWEWYEMEDTCGHYEIDGQCCTIGKTVSCIAE